MSCRRCEAKKIKTVDKEYNRVFSNDESAFLWFKNFCHKYGLHVIECQKYNRWIVEGWNDCCRQCQPDYTQLHLRPCERGWSVAGFKLKWRLI